MEARGRRPGAGRDPIPASTISARGFRSLAPARAGADPGAGGPGAGEVMRSVGKDTERAIRLAVVGPQDSVELITRVGSERYPALALVPMVHENATADLQSMPVIDALKRELTIPVSGGIGFGSTAYEVDRNAHTALQFSRKAGQGTGRS